MSACLHLCSTGRHHCQRHNNIEHTSSPSSTYPILAVTKQSGPKDTNFADLQDIIDGRLERRRKGVYGPPTGKHQVVLVDDLNMPQVEEYGAQAPIELLRQFMDHQGW